MRLDTIRAVEPDLRWKRLECRGTFAELEHRHVQHLTLRMCLATGVARGFILDTRRCITLDDPSRRTLVRREEFQRCAYGLRLVAAVRSG